MLGRVLADTGGHLERQVNPEDVGPLEEADALWSRAWTAISAAFFRSEFGFRRITP